MPAFYTFSKRVVFKLEVYTTNSQVPSITTLVRVSLWT